MFFQRNACPGFGIQCVHRNETTASCKCGIARSVDKQLLPRRACILRIRGIIILGTLRGLNRRWQNRCLHCRQRRSRFRKPWSLSDLRGRTAGSDWRTRNCHRRLRRRRNREPWSLGGSNETSSRVKRGLGSRGLRIRTGLARRLQHIIVLTARCG